MSDMVSSDLNTSSSINEVFAKGYSEQPDANEMELAGKVRNLFLRARDKRRPLIQQWNKNYRMLRNKYYTSARPAYMASPEVPEIFPLIASFVGWMTDQRPTWNTVPYSLPHSPYHEFMSKLGNDLGVVLQARWSDDEIEAEEEKMIWDSQVYGTGIAKVGWDNTEHNGLGDVVVRRVDPYTFYPDPQATSMKDSNYFIEARTYSLQELNRRWPGSGDLFLAGLEEDVDSAPTQLGNRAEMPMANPGAIAPATVPRYSMYGQSRMDTANYEDAGVTVFEAWLREHTVDDDNNVHDGWRVVVVAGNRVLMNEPADELFEHGHHPYERFVPYDMGEFWGISLVELLISPQETLNRLLASIQHNIDLLGNPVFVEGTRSGLQRTQITNKPGQRITVNENSKAEWLSPAPLHQMIPELIRYYLQRMEGISGLSAITRGGSPGGRNAESVVDAMQEAAFVRIRMALRNLERFLRRVGMKAASLVVENYTAPRMIAFIGPDGEQSMAQLSQEHFYLPGPEGNMPMRFKLNVDVGSQTQTSRQARESKAITLFGMGAIDRLALLEAVDWPNRAEIFERISKLEAAGAFQPPGARQRAHRSS
jgi:hypothetical protein